MHGPADVHERHRLEYIDKFRTAHIDGALAPRKNRDGQLCWRGQGETIDKRNRIEYRSEEYPQGQFLLHHLETGFTAIQWWDRCQGDNRGACNSTILLEGQHTSEEMIEALREHFPGVLDNLTRAAVKLVEVHKPKEDWEV